MALLRSIFILSALLLLLFSGPALAADDARLKAEVQALLDQAAAGFDKRDVQAVLATSAAGSKIHYRDGRTISMAQWGEAAAKDMADWKNMKSAFVVEQAWPLGPGHAGALYSERHEFTRVSDPGHQHAVKAHFEAVLTKTPQGWRIMKFIEKDVKLFRDGKAFAPTPPAKPKS